MAAGSGYSVSGGALTTHTGSKSNLTATVFFACCALGATLVTYVVSQRSRHNNNNNNNSESRHSDNYYYKTDEKGRPVAVSATGNCPNNNSMAAAAEKKAAKPAVPVRSYYSMRAEAHVRRHSAALMEWYDPFLGLHIPFSPVMFAVSREERQAPMVLLSLRYLRQDEHAVAITIEELPAPLTPEAYREASLARVSECASVVANNTARIGSVTHPQAEYCYVDASDRLLYALSVFLTHGRLALTVQYTAPTRVRSVLPTAFSEIVRGIRFAEPAPTPSYLLVSEPRLGLGFRLSTQFHVTTGTALQETVSTVPLRHYSTQQQQQQQRQQQQQQFYFPSAPVALPYTTVATATGRGTRRMGVIVCCEPYLMDSGTYNYNSANGNGNALASSSSGGGGGNNGNVNGNGNASVTRSRHPPSQQQQAERQLCSSFGRLGLDHGSGPLRFAFSDETPRGGAGTIVVRPYQTRVSLHGNLSDSDEQDSASLSNNANNNNSNNAASVNGGVGGGGGSGWLSLNGYFCLLETEVEENSPCMPFIRDPLDVIAVENHIRNSNNNNNNNDGNPGSNGNSSGSRAYVGIFILPIGEDCVSFYFVASIARHTFDEFAALCMDTMKSISLGNHHGQSASVLYNNVRHEILPFSVALSTFKSEVVDETLLGDPVALFHSHGVERVSASLRVLPLQAPAGPGPHRARMTASRMLEAAMRAFLEELPERISVQQCERCTVRSQPALKLIYETASYVNSSHNGSHAGTPSNLNQNVLDEDDSHNNNNNYYYFGDGNYSCVSEAEAARSYSIEETVGSLNPLARYYPPPPPPLSFLGVSPIPESRPLQLTPQSPPQQQQQQQQPQSPQNTSVNKNNNGNAGAASAASPRGGGGGGSGSPANNDANSNNNSYNNNNNNTSSGSVIGMDNSVFLDSSMIVRERAQSIGSPSAVVSRLTRTNENNNAASHNNNSNNAANQHQNVNSGNPLEKDEGKVSVENGCYFHARSASRRSDGPYGSDGEDSPLRVVLAVALEGHVFLYSAAASVYSLSSAQETLVRLAEHTTVLPQSAVPEAL